MSGRSEPLAAQDDAEHLSERRIVVHHQDAGSHRLQYFISCATAGSLLTSGAGKIRF
jgi:hypothetical protein